MWWRAVLLIAGICCLAQGLPAQVSFKTAYVTEKQAVLRSGAGSEFYATERIPWGTRLEVYQVVDDAWCAVRPLSQSFSWVKATEIAIDDSQPGEGRVTGSEVPVYIGSQLSDQRTTVSVNLSRGETVEVLGSETSESDRSSDRWLKIAPPSGEFRWIHRQALSDYPPHRQSLRRSVSGGHRPSPGPAEADARLAQPAALNQPAARDVASGSADSIPTEPLTVDPFAVEPLTVELTASQEKATATDAGLNAPERGAWRPMETVMAAAPTAGHAEPELSDVGPNAREPLGLSLTEPPPASFQSASPPPRSAETDDASRLALGNIAAQIDSMIQQPVRVWSLDDLAARVHDVAGQTDDPQVQSDALDLLATIDRLQAILERHRQLTDSRSRTPVPGASPARPLAWGAMPLSGGLPAAVQSLWRRVGPYRPDSTSAAANTPQAASRPRYDGSGWLTTVFSARTGTPQFALTDREGHIFQFVEPQAGLNLRPYLRQEIGVLGRSQYSRELEKPVITAERIVVLNRR